MSHVKKTLGGLFLLIVILSATPLCFADGKPLTEEQIIAMSVGPLKDYPDEIIKLVRDRGVGFFPTKTAMNWLEKSGVSQNVLAAIRKQSASQMRIKICQFTADDSNLAKAFASETIRMLAQYKGNDIEPFGSIPLDQVPCSPQGFDNNVKPEPNIFYILLQGWIRGNAPTNVLILQVVYQDPSGKQHPLRDAEDPPKSLNKQQMESTAYQVVDWVIRTAKQFAAN